MKKFERQKEIESLVKGHEYVLLSAISPVLNCSESTVRRDIDEMEQKGLLTLNQGAVIWNENNAENNRQKEMIYGYRKNQNADIKKLLGVRAAESVVQEDTLFIDTGTTTLELARHLPDIPLTVVTNDLLIAMELENKYNITTIILGGYIRRGTHTIIGGMAMALLENFRFQKAFFSPAGIDPEGDFMFFNLQAMEIRQKVRSISEQCIMIADHTKFGKKGFVKGFSFEQCNLLIADNIPEKWQAFLKPRVEFVNLSTS